MPGNDMQAGFQQMPMQTFANAGAMPMQQWTASPMPADAMTMTQMAPTQFMAGAVPAPQMMSGQTMSFTSAPWIGGGMTDVSATPVMEWQPQFVNQPMPTTVTTAPTFQQGGFEAPGSATAIPTYAPQPVQLGTPSPISQHPGSAIPAISAVVPVVPAF
jgi:hypothetical protein